MKLRLSPEILSKISDVNKSFQSQVVGKADDNSKNVHFVVDENKKLRVVGSSPSFSFTLFPGESFYEAEQAGSFLVSTENLGKVSLSFSKLDQYTNVTFDETHVTFSVSRKKMKINKQRVDSEFALPKVLEQPSKAVHLDSLNELSKSFSLIKGNRYKEDFAVDSVFSGILLDLSSDSYALFAANTSSIAQSTGSSYDGESVTSKIVDPRVIPSLIGAFDGNDKVSISLSDTTVTMTQEIDGSKLIVAGSLLNFSTESMRRERLLKQATAMVDSADIYITVDGREVITAIQEAASIDRASSDSVVIKIVGDRIAIQSITSGAYGAEISGSVKKKATSPDSITIEVGSTNIKSMLSKKASSVIRFKSSEKSGVKLPMILVGDDEGVDKVDLNSGWFLIETGISK